MSDDPFVKLLESKKILIADGATGSNLIQRGLPHGTSAESWVLDHPQAILQLHKDFIQAGAEIILTCTFGASELRLAQSDLAERFKEVNQRAVELAREAIGEKDVLLAASIGPLGQMLQPLGKLTMESAQQYYRSQAQLLNDAGVDLLIVETQYDLNETLAAIMGIREASSLPLICSFSFDRGLRSMMGVSPKQFAEAMRRFNLSAIGINCGKSLEDNLNALKELKENTNLPIWFKPNAGLPKVDAAGMPSYDITPDIMAAQVPDWIETGARIIGGCCGTSPQHLQAIAAQVNKLW